MIAEVISFIDTWKINFLFENYNVKPHIWTECNFFDNTQNCDDKISYVVTHVVLMSVKKIFSFVCLLIIFESEKFSLKTQKLNFGKDGGEAEVLKASEKFPLELMLFVKIKPSKIL